MRAAVAGALSVVLVAAGCTAERDPDDAAAGPPHTDEVVDATDLHYVPTQLSSQVGDRADLAVEAVGDGYRLTTSGTGGPFEVAVAPASPGELRQSEVGGADRRAAYEVDDAAGRVTWTDALATVTITAPGTAARELEELADSMLLVDTATYETFLADPGHRFEPGEAVLAELPMANRTLRVEVTGSLADSGLTLGLDGLGSTLGTDASLVAAASAGPGTTQLTAWQDDGRTRAVLLVPDGFVRLTSGQEDLRWWQAEDARLGRLVLVDGPGERAVRVTVEAEGRPDEPVRISARAWS